MKSIKIVNLIVCLCFLKLTKSAELLGPLKNDCISLKSLQNRREELKAQDEAFDKEQEYDMNSVIEYHKLVGVEDFISRLYGGERCMGNGWLKNVFAFDYYDPEKDYNLVVSAELVKLKGDPSNKDHLKRQKRFARKLKAWKKIMKMKNSEFLFMDLYGVYDITEMSNSIRDERKSEIMNRKIFPKINTSDDEILLVLFREKAKLTFQNLIDGVKRNLASVSYYQMMYLVHNLLDGLQIMEDICLNGNIKPEKIMIIKVDEYTEREERDELEKNGLHSVEINFGHIYIPKYADAGEGVEGSMEKRKLSGKTNAYSAPEVGKKDQMQYKADIFSLGKVLVELELASEFNVSLTRLEKIINESAKRGEDKVNTPEIILLEETRLFSRMKEILSENQKYKKNVMEEMLKANPELKEIVDKFEPVCEFLERDPLQIMYKKHLVLKEMIYAFLKVYYNKYIEEVETPYKVAQVDSVLDKNLRSNYKTHYQKLKETIPFYQKLKKDLFNIYMGMMNPNVNDRLRISEVHKIVVSLIKTYKKDQESLVNDLITFLKEYDHDNYSKDYYQDLTWLKENVIYSQCRRRILI